MRGLQAPLAVAASNPIVQTFLYDRGFTLSDVPYLLHPEAAHQHSPFLLQGVDLFIDTLHACKGKVISIHPDYDADGVTSGIAARVGLYVFGFGDVFVYPPRLADGYGLSPKSVDRLLMMAPDTEVIITTDNGSKAYEGIAYAKAKGLIVLVTDHHLADQKPSADAVVNPNAHGDQTYPFRHISGAAVIYKVLWAYGMKYAADPASLRAFGSLLLLVGLSLVADVMPMRDENRFYVSRAVDMLSSMISTFTPDRVFSYGDSPLDQYYRGVDLLIGTLMSEGKLKNGVTSDTFGFVIGPMLNCARRMTSESIQAFQLFHMTRQSLAASPEHPAQALFRLNEARKAHVKSLTQSLLRYVETSPDRPEAHMVFNAVMGAGVAGLLSGKFTEHTKLPNVAFAAPAPDDFMDDPNYNPINVPLTSSVLLTGSARAPLGFNLYALLSEIDAENPGLIVSWGGHDEAAGLRIHARDFLLFRSIFVEKATLRLQETPGLTFDPSVLPLTGDFALSTATHVQLMSQYTLPAIPVVALDQRQSARRHELLWDAVRFFDQVKPFGQGFAAPVFTTIFSMNDVNKVFTMGAAKNHAKLILHNGLTLIYWDGASVFAPDGVPIQTGMFIAAGGLSINVYNDSESLQLIAKTVKAWEPSAEVPSLSA